MPEHPSPVDLTAVDGDGGVVWSVAPDGLNANLVVLGPGQAIAEHRNDELDVLVVVVAGTATVTVDGVAHELSAATALLVPRGARRSVAPSAAGVRYLTVHRRRRGLDVTRPAAAGPAHPATAPTEAEPGATPDTGSRPGD
jgi:quercetin dioxygenase-like cupin family protein